MNNNTQQPHQPRGGVSGCLAGKPFKAAFHRTGASDDLWVSKLARDRAGSTRTDLSDGQYSWILDCKKQQTVFIDHKAKVALITPVVLAGTAPLMGFNKLPSPTNEFENILNLACRKILLYEDREQTKQAGELWFSESLGIVMRDISGGGSLKWEAVSITLDEPKDVSFEAPSDYAKQQTTGTAMPKPAM